jgi:hypothetical protein
MDLLIFRSIDLSIHPSIYLFIFVPIYLSTYPPIYLSIHPSVCPSIHLTILPIYLSQSLFSRQIATWPVWRIRKDKYESLRDRSHHRSKGPGTWTHRCLFRAVRKRLTRRLQDQTTSVRQRDTAFTILLLRRNHRGKAPCDIVRRIGCFKLRKLLAVRKNTPEARLLGNEPVRKDTVGLTYGRCLPPAHASTSALRPEKKPQRQSTLQHRPY